MKNEANKPIIEDSFEGIPKSSPSQGVEMLSIAYADLSCMMTEALVILDLKHENFLYVPNHDLFLCGYSRDEVYERGFDFFKEALHPKDVPIWENIRNIILNIQNNDKLSIDTINYFAFTLRFTNFFSKDKKRDKISKYSMVYLKLKSIWIDGELRYGICLLSGSVVAKPGNLCVYYDNQDYAEYSQSKKTWKHYLFAPLTKRKRELLIWVQKGLTQKEIADYMDISEKTVENHKSALFSKFEVNSMVQALQYASNRRLIFHPSIDHFKTTGKNKALHSPPSPTKKNRNKLTNSILSYILEELNQGKKVYQIAKTTGIPDSTIRKAIQSEKLNKNQAKKSH